MTPERKEYYAKKYLLERVAFWGAKLKEIEQGVFYTEEDKALFYHIYIDYKNELGELDVDIGNFTEEGHW